MQIFRRVSLHRYIFPWCLAVGAENHANTALTASGQIKARPNELKGEINNANNLSRKICLFGRMNNNKTSNGGVTNDLCTPIK